jgi:hypothetical protein
MGSSQKSYSFFESYSFWMSMIYEKIYFMLKVLRIWSHNYQLNDCLRYDICKRRSCSIMGAGKPLCGAHDIDVLAW